MIKSITEEDIEQAYLYLKSGIYYENNALLYLKKQISDFEYENKFLNKESRNKKFKEILKIVNSSEKKIVNSELFEKIKYKKIIKKLKENTLEDKLLEEVAKGKIDSKKLKKIIDENKQDVQSKIEFNYIIDCPIELHIISVLWILKTGYLLDKKMSKYSYGYRLNLDDNERIKGKNIFKKYPAQYQNWKENGLKIAREIIEIGEDAVLINLDLTKFYYNIDHEKLKIKLKENNIEECKLTKIIIEINKKYGAVVGKNTSYSQNTILPIGLYSSAILANFYLKELDDKILKECSPSYYGRYVDDLFIIFKEYSSNKVINKNEYIKTKLKNLSKSTLGKIGIKESFDFESILYNKKTRIIFLNDSQKEIELSKLEDNFLERVSTFSYLPNESTVEGLYKKISISEEKNSQIKKYDVSVYLTKIIEIYSGIDSKKNLKEMKRQAKILIDYFSGENIIKYSSYYEKVLIFLVMGKFSNELELFYKNIKKELENAKESKDSEDIRDTIQYLDNSLLFALALNPKLITKISYNLKMILKNSIKLNIDMLEGEEVYDDENIDEIILNELYKIINSNMLRQKFVNYPLLNFLDFEIGETSKKNILKKINFFQTRYFDIAENPQEMNNLKLCDEKIKLSPRFIHLDEFNIFYIKQHILLHDEMCGLSNNKNLDYFYESKEKFLLNYTRNPTKNSEIFKKSIIKEKNGILDFYKISTHQPQKDIKIGIASMVIKEEEIFPILDGDQNLSLEKKERIINILNQAKKNKVEIIIFPEAAIPFQWLGILNEFSRKNDIVITGGLEYIFCPELEYNIKKSPKYAFNYLFTILPFSTLNYGTSFINIRLKNHYAPGECNVIEGKRFVVPKITKKKYNIFSWKGVHFSNFNCFELADIQDRSQLKNYIDLLVTSVFNKDTVYFKNVLESTCRDLHVFIAQSNTAIYGDCEVIQPTSKDYMTLGNIKGGLNDNLLVVKLEIEKLRKFQLLDTSSQSDKKNYFKYTPPGIDPNIVKIRIKNELDIYIRDINGKIRQKEERIKAEEKQRIARLLTQNDSDYERLIEMIDFPENEKSL